jgi:tetratricopeptide (TPR) repeat protein
MRTLGRKVSAALLAIAAALPGVAAASDNPAMHADVMHINNQWAHIRYEVTDRNQQFRQLAALAVQAKATSARYPGEAEPLLWQGIVVSEEAARASLINQLGLAKSARDILQRARAIDPDVGNGGGAMSLGVLYYKVPGFPIGFGDAKKARAMLQSALAHDPNGLDANFFYADFLESQGDHAGAKTYLARALRAPVDHNRPVWDAGRRAEARTLLAKISH